MLDKSTLGRVVYLLANVTSTSVEPGAILPGNAQDRTRVYAQIGLGDLRRVRRFSDLTDVQAYNLQHSPSMHHFVMLPVRRINMYRFYVVFTIIVTQFLVAHNPVPVAPAAHAVTASVPVSAQMIYGADFHPTPYQTPPDQPERTYVIRRQGNDSNCDYIAVSNGIQNIGGDGEKAYWLAREFVPQLPRDYREAFYTLLGPQGSDSPFSLDNLGAAPEAFVGVYPALGYNAVMLAAQPGAVDLAFAQAIRDRLIASPDTTFAHLWTTPRPYNPQARLLDLPETGEQVSLLYPYHEVAAMAVPGQPDRLLILDGLVGHAFTLSLEEVAYQLRGFNRVIVVSSNPGPLEAQQRFQMTQAGQPFVSDTLGGAYLTTARQTWGPAYQTWGRVIGQPYRVATGQNEMVVLPGEYVQYERIGTQPVTLAPVGKRMGEELVGMGVLPAGMLYPAHQPGLVNGIRDSIAAQFGSVEAFQQAFGSPISAEFWLSHEQMAWFALRGEWHPLLEYGQADGYICMLTERAMIAWNGQSGAVLVPLGRVYYRQQQRELGISLP